jgi:hypothetical protein
MGRLRTRPVDLRKSVNVEHCYRNSTAMIAVLGQPLSFQSDIL